MSFSYVLKQDTPIYKKQKIVKYLNQCDDQLYALIVQQDQEFVSPRQWEKLVEEFVSEEENMFEYVVEWEMNKIKTEAINQPKLLLNISHIKFDKILNLSLFEIGIANIQPLTWIQIPNIRQIMMCDRFNSLKPLSKLNLKRISTISLSSLFNNNQLDYFNRMHLNNQSLQDFFLATNKINYLNHFFKLEAFQQIQQAIASTQIYNIRIIKQLENKFPESKRKCLQMKRQWYEKDNFYSDSECEQSFGNHSADAEVSNGQEEADRFSVQQNQQVKELADIQIEKIQQQQISEKQQSKQQQNQYQNQS